ncbi:MAG TPA: TonB-dependent receptor [Flavobacteriaceae bacterium]|nr:TonB-dependent receptor [Flavobacteriaceae bacterium]
MKCYQFLFIFFVLFCRFSFSQQKETVNLDSIQDLNPVILTAQYRPQSVDKSIFEVDVLTQSDIQKMAGNTLDDVLKQTLNLNVIPNSGEGRSGIQQFGFNSEYVKILIDGVPFIGDEGFGNAIDISQINIDDIEQIEIVEGAMGVQYGANAVTGVVNIITKKSSRHKWNLTPYIQEETLGSEYNWSDKGRHIQSFKVGYNFSDSWYGEISFIRNDFRGFYGQKNGRYFYNPQDPNDKTRGYDWLPKMQHTGKTLLNYNGKKFRAFYKFEYFNERTDSYANQVRLNLHGPTQTVDPTANDRVFRTDRQYHHVNLTGDWQEMNYSISVSYQEQVRNREGFTRKLLTGEKNNVERYDYNTRKGLFSRGTLNEFLKSNWISTEAGYEITVDRGEASGLSEQNTGTDTQLREVNSFSGFLSTELIASKKLSFRPGIRYTTSNVFRDQIALSLSSKLDFNNGYQLRAVLGTAPKLPNFEELYFYMVDSNHDVRGNQNLKPEKGRSVFLHLKKRFATKNNVLSYQPKFSVWYLDVEDKIDLIVANPSPLSFQYANIDTYKTWGVAFRNKIYYKQFSAGIGIALNGESKILNSSNEFDDDFLYSMQLSGQFSYSISKWKTSISAYYKYNGKQYQFVLAPDDFGEATITKDKQDAYSWLDLSARKTFWNDQFELSLGARNLLDVKEIKTTSTSGAGHSSNSPMMLGYGRSYFLKFLYNINF